MAGRNRAKDLQVVVNCSICLDYFNDPVILKCGHSFCRACITRHCESADFMDISPTSWPCPLCREAFREGEFQPNRKLRNIVGIAKKIPEPKGRRACKEHGKLLKLFCEVDETPICLVCRESPTHKEHRVAPADEAAQDYKAQIQSRLDILKKERGKILSFKLGGENESQELLEQLETVRQKIVSDFLQWRQFLEEQERLLLAQLAMLNKKIEKSRDEYVAKLSEELSSFSSLISEMEQKCQQPASAFLQDIKGTLNRCKREKFQNPVAFPSELQRRIKELSQKNASVETTVKKIFKDSLSSTQQLDQGKVSKKRKLDQDQKETSPLYDGLPCKTPRLQPTISRFSSLGKVSKKRQLDKGKVLKEELLDQGKVSKKRQLDKANVTLDPDTAHPDLIVSADRKSVRRGHTREALPNNPERFDTVRCVLGCEGFTSGRHYWEVDTEVWGIWAMGVARESVTRKGHISSDPEQGIWAMLGRGDQYWALTSPEQSTPLSLSQAPNRIRVYLDYEGGQVAFFNASNGDLMFTFPPASFTGERIRPFFQFALRSHSNPFLFHPSKLTLCP